MNRRICFSTLACPRWGWDETARRAAEYGYQGVETRMIAGDVDLLAQPELAPGRRAASRQIYDDLGIALCGLASSVRFDYASESQRADQVEIGRRYLDLALDLGAEFVRVFGDVLPSISEPAARSNTLEQIAEGLRLLGEHAQSQTPGVRVVIETHGDFAETRLMAELLNRIPHTSVGILWDTHHPWSFHGEPLQESLARLGERVWHTHWKDSLHSQNIEQIGNATGVEPRSAPLGPGTVPADGGAEAVAAAERARQLMSGHRDVRYTLFGDGDFPGKECLTLLDSRGYTGWYSLEWEKAWHPELADPEVALPQFPARFRQLAGR